MHAVSLNLIRAIAVSPHSVPHGAAFAKVTIKAYVDRVAIVHHAQVVSEHRRGYGKHESFIDPLHFVAALPNTHYFEYCVEQGALRKSLTKQTFPVIDGDISVPEGPGPGEAEAAASPGTARASNRTSKRGVSRTLSRSLEMF